jgi:AcrR family transcriptional regulator
MSKQERRQAIMHEAEKLFTSRQFHEVTLDEVAMAAHVGKGTIYRYFKDKDDLFFQVATSGYDELCAVIQTKVPDDGPFIERLKSACRKIGGFYSGRRHLMRMMHGEAGRMRSARGAIKKEWHDRNEQLIGQVAAIFEEGMAQGAVRSDIPAQVLATFLLGMLRTRARELADTHKASADHGMMADLFFSGACAQNGNGHTSQIHATAAAM